MVENSTAYAQWGLCEMVIVEWKNRTLVFFLLINDLISLTKRQILFRKWNYVADHLPASEKKKKTFNSVVHSFYNL